MASLLNNASLLLNPAGSIIAYEEDKIFSVLPSNGAGDFAFSGGDGGTRVNQQGYIEQTPANFMLNSGTTWTPFNVTITTGITDPVGGTGAYTIGSIASGNITDYGAKGSNTMPLSAGTVITLSIYMKGSGTIATYLERSIGGTYWFDVKTHTLSSNWQIFTHTYTVPTDASGVGVYVGNATGTTATSVDIAFPMLNYGSTAKPYQPTTDRLNYPRITYQNGRGALLSEPQRTNLYTYSNQFNQWTTSAATATINYAISPDGTQNANRVQFTSGGLVYRSNTGSSGQNTLSVYAKATNGNNAKFRFFANGATLFSSDQTVTGEWKLFTFTYTYSFVTAGLASPTTNGGVDDVLFYGFQHEIGEFPTSYIPTTSATVTRPADVAIKTGASSLIGQSAGTVYFDFTLDNLCDGLQTNQPVLWYMKDGGTGERYVQLISGNRLVYVEYNGAVIANMATSAINTGRHKCVIAYANNDMAIYVDGIQMGIDGNGTPSGFSTVSTQYYNSTYYGQCKVHSLAPYTSRLTNTQLAELTTVRSGSGGTISYYGPYTVHTFTGSATFTPSFNGQVEVLVVAGGGGGGGGESNANGGGGGGGGAGGLIYASSYGVSQGAGVTVTIGAGGVGSTNYNMDGSNGSNSVFGGFTAIGGGGGSGEQSNGGKNGGSGGGTGGDLSSGTEGQGIVGQGNPGGGIPNSRSGGAGGGAGASGSNPTDRNGASGGIGKAYSISGFSTYYAGGGGGGGSTNFSGVIPTSGIGGLGGGGNSSGLIGGTDNPSTPGVSYTGGGGGAARAGLTAGGNGGSGIVIVRYLT
jgi:hypothetical protein